MSGVKSLPAATAVDSANSVGNFRQIFPEGTIYIVADDESLVQAADRDGFNAVSLSAAEKLPHGANVVLFLRQVLVSADVRRKFNHAKVLTVPIASFDPSLAAALYTQQLTVLTDYAAACERNRYWADSIKNQAGALIFSDENSDTPAGAAQRTHLVCSLAEDLSCHSWLEPTLEAGQWVSVGTYCEFSMTAPLSTDWCGAFTIDGTALVDGVLVARDPRCTGAGDVRIRGADRLRAELVARRPISLHLDHGVLTAVQADGEDFTDAVLEATNPEYGLHTIELGIGTNQDVLPHVDWRINSQLNEGAGDVHLGFGEGITGAHMDFIVAKSGHRFEASA
jgi:hypothetical protein